MDNVLQPHKGVNSGIPRFVSKVPKPSELKANQENVPIGLKRPAPGSLPVPRVHRTTSERDDTLYGRKSGISVPPTPNHTAPATIRNKMGGGKSSDDDSYASTMVKEMWARLGEKDKELEQKRQEFQDHANKHMQVLNDLNRLCFEKQKVEDDNEALRRKIDSLRRENEHQQQEIAGGSAQIKELTENADNLMSLWESSVKEMDSEKEAKEKDVKELLDKLEKKGLLVEQQERMLAQIKAELDEKNELLVSLQTQSQQKVDDLKHEMEAQIKGLRQDEEQMRGKVEEQHRRALEELNRRHDESRAHMEERYRSLGREKDDITDQLKSRVHQCTLFEQENATLKSQIHDLSISSNQASSLTSVLQSQIDKLQHQNESQYGSMEQMKAAVAHANRERDEACKKLLVEETKRRKLHNEIQELRGNIRVFSRVRPMLESESRGDSTAVQMDFADDENMSISTPQIDSITGQMGSKTTSFKFDRVFRPSASNADVFAEVSQLVQSALDGFNVCIFAYGQTGSGKTHTMSGEGGVIPETLQLIFQQTHHLRDKGWEYVVSGQFIEIYNENLNDLLGSASDMDSKKLEIRHDMKAETTSVVGIEPVVLSDIDFVNRLLRKSDKNRMVAATKANERSSRSHSVFIVSLKGVNHVTGESCDGRLNLIDLAGSERLNHSGATGDRLRETQNINKSLACLGDVIHALGSAKEGSHIPYRNSKLTYLLQYSLGGNSKTLMLVNVSPMQAHASETINSLRFATKVNNTHIGRAKRN
ncbi:Kinesin-like protein klpA [Yarrowia sp. B02]|nr:Kinesin-like protein klpA [Yarrowia sp. B02]